MQSLLAGQRGRLLAGAVLVALLGGCLLWAGAAPGDPLESAYPDEVEVTPASEGYVGEQVSLGGQVVDTDPVVIATRASGYGRFTLVDADDRLQNADGPLERGNHVTAFGTLEDDSTLVVERTTTRESSETGYMLVVSALGGLWVVGRFVRGWRFDRATLAFVPREPSSEAANQPSRRQEPDQRDQSHRARDRRDQDHRARNQREQPHRNQHAPANTDGGDRRA